LTQIPEKSREKHDRHQAVPLLAGATSGLLCLVLCYGLFLSGVFNDLVAWSHGSLQKTYSVRYATASLILTIVPHVAALALATVVFLLVRRHQRRHLDIHQASAPSESV
jgi:hypothetical protein